MTTMTTTIKQIVSFPTAFKRTVRNNDDFVFFSSAQTYLKLDDRQTESMFVPLLAGRPATLGFAVESLSVVVDRAIPRRSICSMVAVAGLSQDSPDSLFLTSWLVERGDL